jgi:hypothetical protein
MVNPREDEIWDLFARFFEYEPSITTLKDEKIYSNGPVTLKKNVHRKLPIQFGVVKSLFLSDNELTSLEGCPTTVNTIFRCDKNNLQNLLGGPHTMSEIGWYTCIDNPLTSLDGLPKNCGDLMLTYNARLPLLRLITLNAGNIHVMLHYNVPAGNIEYLINKYRSTANTNKKELLWKVQQDLIQRGLEDNARW